MRTPDRYATDRVTLRWILLVICTAAALALLPQGVYLSPQGKHPVDFIGQ